MDKETFIRKANIVHDFRYNYDNVDFVNSKTPVCIICPKHGEFWQTPSSHLRGRGCPKCMGGVRKSTEEFIKQAINKHGDKYSYEKVEYVNSHTPVEIICQKHGSFMQAPCVHLRGCGCPKCGGGVRYSGQIFIENAIKVHGNKYDYTKVKYINNKTKVCIICPAHGEFWQTPEKHLLSKGCPKCNGFNRTTEEFITEAKKVHGDKYDYSKTNYVGSKKKVCIICPKHGEFWQTAQSHLSGKGCKLCGFEKTGKSLSFSKDEFIAQARNLYGDRYDYSKVNYVSMRTHVIIGCREHGDFEQTPDMHLRACGCKHCLNKHISSAETEIFEYVSRITEAKRNVKTLIGPKEIDIFLPKYNIGIEYNGIIWHSEKYKEKYADYNKMLECNKVGIKLIQIYEDEWLFKKEIVLDKIRHLLGKNFLPKVMGRKCSIKEITFSEAQAFLDKNHIQGGVRGTLYLGAFTKSKLIAAMVFRRENKNRNDWELSRYATDINYICQGVASKLFSYFVKKYFPEKVKSFADRRWTLNEDNNLYTKLNFHKDGYVRPDYKYFVPGRTPLRQHKFNFRKKILNKKYGLSLSLTEGEMTKELNFYRIWDCGLIRYVWTSEPEK